MTNWFIRNQILLTVALAWSSAQLIKTIVYLWIEGKFRAERLVGDGGMPSAHSATVCSLAVSAAFMYTIHSFEFSMSLVMAIIVMHDAMGVRLETGKQAKVINAMLMSNPFEWKGEVFEQNLKELVGHTPLQVLMGAILGVGVALLIQLIIFYIR